MKVYTREKALEEATKYFGGNTLAAEVFISKYALRNEKLEWVESTPDQMHKRLAAEFAKTENKFPNPLSEKEIFEMFDQFKYLIPGGSPMFGIGNPYQRVSLSNCFVIDTVDSYGGICRTDERIAQISKRRGGVGLDISPIRPRGAKTRNSAFTTDGITVFMERFANTSREVAQSGRRGALMLSISVHHPEILNFIKIKRDLQKVNGANISVRVTDEFMEAVKKNKKYELRWPVDSDEPKMSSKVNAKEVWDELVKSNYLSAEPGILFWDNIIRNSPADSYADEGFKTCGVNPCITGETLVYVADGRGNVSIKELSDKGKDVPVFCYDNNGKVTIKKMRHPRVTGHKKPIYKITLDDESTIRVTGNHMFRLTDGNYKRVDKLEKGDGLKILTKYESHISKGKNKKSKTLYNWIANGFRDNKCEHRYIGEYLKGEKLNKKEVIHHKNYNGLDNSFDNLEVLCNTTHDQIHRKDKLGDKNPMRRAKIEWSKEKWQQYHNNMSKAVSGEKNGRYINVANEEIKRHAILLTLKLDRRFSKNEWRKYAKDNILTIAFSNWRIKSIGTIFELSKWAAKECNIQYIDKNPRSVRVLQLMLDQGYDAFINGNQVFVKKICEECGSKFIRRHGQREVAFCSLKCASHYVIERDRAKIKKRVSRMHRKKSKNTMYDQIKIFTELRFNLERVPLRKEWEKECLINGIAHRLGTKYGFRSYKVVKEAAKTFNHRVVSVELDGYEDVYSGTVDDFHNFFVGGFESKTKHSKRKWVYINNQNCGELPTASGTTCILMALNLVSYIVNPFTDKATFNFKKFKSYVRKAQRLMDDLVEMEIEAVKKIIDKIKSDPEEEEIKANELSLWKAVLSKGKDSRRTGLGITGLGDCIAMLNVKYGSQESIEIVEKIYSNLRNEAYKSSIELAKERGAFPIFDFKKERGNEYLGRLPSNIRAEMNKYGRRNIACLTTPPAGSGSTVAKILDLFGTTSGFEPAFKTEYKRKRKLSDKEEEKEDFIDGLGDRWKEYIIIHSGLQMFKKITGKETEESPYFGAQAEDIDFLRRVEMQAVATQYVDHAISSTVNLPMDVNIEIVSNLYIEAWEQGCKGLTIYRAGTRDGVLTSMNSTRECEDCDEASKELVKLIEEGRRPSKIITAASPVRPNVLECDIHRSKVGGGDWLFFIGKLNGHPYEIFGGDIEKFVLPHKYKNGWICKNGKIEGITQYNLILGSLNDDNEKLEFKGIAKHFNNYEYGAFTRLASLTMRHGAPIKYICEQITKKGVEGDLFSFQRAMARILKKYISEGEKSETECPECGSPDVIYKNGCPTCQLCGHSNCA